MVKSSMFWLSVMKVDNNKITKIREMHIMIFLNLKYNSQLNEIKCHKFFRSEKPIFLQFKIKISHLTPLSAWNVWSLNTPSVNQ